jgi:hypothetical protein
MKQTRNRLLALAFVGMCTSSCAHRESRENLELLAVQFQHSVMDLLPVPPAQKADQVEAAPRNQPLTQDKDTCNPAGCGPPVRFKHISLDHIAN